VLRDGLKDALFEGERLGERLTDVLGVIEGLKLTDKDALLVALGLKEAERDGLNDLDKLELSEGLKDGDVLELGLSDELKDALRLGLFDAETLGDNDGEFDIGEAPAIRSHTAAVLSPLLK